MVHKVLFVCLLFVCLFVVCLFVWVFLGGVGKGGEYHRAYVQELSS